MSDMTTRYDRLAVRLSLIISRLLSGESLSSKSLAHEFTVSERTIQRDFNLRLAHMGLECSNGKYSLPLDDTFRQHQDTFSFLRQTGLVSFFPRQDRRLVNLLLYDKNESPCLIWHPSQQHQSSSIDCFDKLVTSINRTTKVHLVSSEGRYEYVEPHRLIFSCETWYLVAWYQRRIHVFLVEAMHDVVVTKLLFARRKLVNYFLSQDTFVKALPHFNIIYRVFNATHE